MKGKGKLRIQLNENEDIEHLFQIINRIKKEF